MKPHRDDGAAVVPDGRRCGLTYPILTVLKD